jgi:succinate-semialdehyde dehydrogenase/glutarate-semialdehyde dehydrogenase
MALTNHNPFTGEPLPIPPYYNPSQIDAALQHVARAASAWRDTPLPARASCLRQAAGLLRAGIARYAALMGTEMGKPVREARAEVEKCAGGCDYYAQHAADFLADDVVMTDASRSFVAYQPMGTVLAIMPWNFPFWQVFRCAAPALMAGNTVVLKHASNVPQCALAIEQLLVEAGFPEHVFRSLILTGAQAEALIADPRIHAVSFTGSETAGRRVAAAAGAHLKKSVLELGGSDPFVVLRDADLDLAAEVAVHARFQNTGQSCIAAKRLILVDAIADEFLRRYTPRVAALVVGDPADQATQVGPLARADLRAALHQQVTGSLARGAQLLLGGLPLAGRGFFYAPTLLDRVAPGMPAYEEELFGPVASVIRARDDTDALRLANDTRFGLGGSVWTRDTARGEGYARQLQSGAAFVNGMVKSDPRLPFGGIKASGYGRELCVHGLREFVNVKTVWVR